MNESCDCGYCKRTSTQSIWYNYRIKRGFWLPIGIRGYPYKRGVDYSNPHISFLVNILTKVRKAYDDVWLLYIAASCKAVGIGGFTIIWLMYLAEQG